MLRISLLCVGRMKEAYFASAFEEYRKRLRRYCRFSMTELNEYSDPAREGLALSTRIPPGSYVVALCIEGKPFSSQELADFLAERAMSDDSRLCFLIGGSNGLSEAVKNRAALRLSMSPMTFPHHLARVMLMEQLYRAFSINAGAKYHK